MLSKNESVVEMGDIKIKMKGAPNLEVTPLAKGIGTIYQLTISVTQISIVNGEPLFSTPSY